MTPLLTTLSRWLKAKSEEHAADAKAANEAEQSVPYWDRQFHYSSSLMAASIIEADLAGFLELLAKKEAE